jgi:hypothetical protein
MSSPYLHVEVLPYEQQVIARLRRLQQVRAIPVVELLDAVPEGRYRELRDLADTGLALLAQVPRAQGPLQPLVGLELELVYPQLTPTGIQQTFEGLYAVYSGLRDFNQLVGDAHGMLLDETTAAALPELVSLLKGLRHGFYAHIDEDDGVTMGDPI